MANPVTMTSLDPILKEFYQGPIIDALNSQLEMVQLFTKSTLDWQGRRVIIPVHVSRNTGTDYLAEGAVLPTAGSQDYLNLDIRAKYLYGRFELTGQAIATARTTANSFATYVQSEMDRLVTDVKVKANQAMYTGQGCVGFIWEHINTLTGAGPGFAPTTTVYNFSGNKEHLRSLQVRARALPGAAVTDFLRVEITRLDTYSSAFDGSAAANQYAGAYTDASLGADNVIHLTSCTVGTAPHPGPVANDGIRLNGGGGAFPGNAELRANTACLVRVVASGDTNIPANEFVDNTAGAGASNIAGSLAAEQMGLYGNLGLQTHFGIDRNLISTTASGAAGTAQATTARPPEGGNHELRAAAIETNCDVPLLSAAVPADAVDFERMQAMLDQIMVLGGDNPDCIYMHPIMRQKYAAALLWTATAANAGNLNKDVNGPIGKGDPGFSGYAFAGVPVKVSRHCGKGLAVFLNTRVWTVTELQSFGMADLDGNILSRVTNRDQWEGFIRWYYDLVCKEPNRNAILVGIQFAT